eukprot:332324-Pyramimonas_sp.AAC.2
MQLTALRVERLVADSSAVRAPVDDDKFFGHPTLPPPPSAQDGRGEAAADFDPEDPSDDEAPGVPKREKVPVQVGGCNHRGSAPAESGRGLGLRSVECELERQTYFSCECRGLGGVPEPGQLLASDSQNCDTLRYSEDEQFESDSPTDELSQKLPLTGQRRTCTLRVGL